MMNVWIGHYKGNPAEWFLVWAETEDAAYLLIDAMEGEPDKRSMRVLGNEGLVNFRAALTEESGEAYAEVQPSSLVLMEADNDRVVDLLREPLDIPEPAPSLDFLSSFVPGIEPARRYTWAYGANDPDVLFLSLTPGTADDLKAPDISDTADAEWFAESDSDFVRHCGMFLGALENSKLHVCMGVERLQGAVCNLSSVKVGSGDASRQREEAKSALLYGLPRLRTFLEMRTRPILIIVADPGWIDTVTEDGARWLTLLENKNRTTFGGVAKDHGVLTYDLAGEFQFPDGFASPIVSTTTEYALELGTFPRGVVIFPAVMFSRYTDRDEDWEKYFDSLMALVARDLTRLTQAIWAL